jgi:hypothetical protein
MGINAKARKGSWGLVGDESGTRGPRRAAESYRTRAAREFTLGQRSSRSLSE